MCVCPKMWNQKYGMEYERNPCTNQREQGSPEVSYIFCLTINSLCSHWLKTSLGGGNEANWHKEATLGGKREKPGDTDYDTDLQTLTGIFIAILNRRGHQMWLSQHLHGC